MNIEEMDGTVFDDKALEKTVLEQVRRMAAGQEDYHRRRKVVEAKYVELVKAHPHHWVALAEGDVWVVAESSEALYAEMDQQKLDRGSAFDCYLHPNPPHLAL